MREVPGKIPGPIVDEIYEEDIPESVFAINTLYVLQTLHKMMMIEFA